MSVTKQCYGKMPDGREVDLYVLTGNSGLTVKIVTYGAMIAAVETPDRNGKIDNITLYRESLADYLKKNPCLGTICGRYANRIAKGRFTLDGKEYVLPTNDGGKHHLHGGMKGFDKVLWRAVPLDMPGAAGLGLAYDSADGEEGYPGNLAAKVTYLFVGDELRTEYQATTDKPTVVNLTNHAYWNLAGAGSGDVYGHELTIYGDSCLPTDEDLIPVGAPTPVRGTPVDFTSPTAIGARIDDVPGGYDHCYVLNKRDGDRLPELAARVTEPQSGRVMEVYTTQPAIQLYSGNFLDGTITTAGKTYNKHHGFCLETQHYPDSPNHADYPSTVLRPGEIFRHTTVHKFGVAR